MSGSQRRSRDNDTSTQRKHSPNLTEIKDDALCRAFVSIGDDELVGNEQEWASMWKQIEEAYLISDPRVMIPAPRGSIISTASVCSLFGGLAPHAYTTSKHIVVGLTKNAVVELRQYGITVNCISPYALATPLMMDYFSNKKKNKIEEMMFHSVKLRGSTLEPEDLAHAALYLGSDDSMM